MYAKVILVAAALAPAALAQATFEPFNFECNRGMYGYGYSSGSNNNNLDELNFSDILGRFDDIASIFKNGSLTTRTSPTGNIGDIAQQLFNHYEDAFCQITSLSDALTKVRETDNEQHELCHAKSFNDLTLDNWLMNLEAQVPFLKNAFENNGLPPVANCTQALDDAFRKLSSTVNKVAPICTTTENTSTNLVKNTLDAIKNAFGL